MNNFQPPASSCSVSLLEVHKCLRRHRSAPAHSRPASSGDARWWAAEKSRASEITAVVVVPFGGSTMVPFCVVAEM